ncbi:MAG TPA: alpha-galactosidase, partial [Anaerolineales bacterium]|nr:alpha-galactosidase [Anaerolineales bacterium]
MLSLETSTLCLTIAPDQAAWSLAYQTVPDFEFTQVHLRLHYIQGGQRRTLLDDWPGCTVSGPGNSPSPLGMSQTVHLVFTPAPGLEMELVFALHESPACLLWKIKLVNQDTVPLTMERIELIADHPAATIHLGEHRQTPPNDLAFFSNGWQSWSYTGAYAPQDRFHHTRLGFLHQPMVLNAGTPRPGQPGHFASDMFAVLGSRSTRRAWLAGFLSQLQHFGSLEARLDRSPPALRMWANGDNTRLDPGQSMETDWACLFPIQLDDPDPLGAFAHAVAQTYACTGLQHQAISGWCSWYHYYLKVRPADVLDNIQAASTLRHRLPLELIQLDDGFEYAVGDWLSFSSNFPQGVAPLAAQISAQKFTPGLWLAPFIVDPRSELAHTHPDWLLRGRFNRPVNAGFTFWGSFATGLDLTHPEAMDYAARVTRTAAREWGYPFLK